MGGLAKPPAPGHTGVRLVVPHVGPRQEHLERIGQLEDALHHGPAAEMDEIETAQALLRRVRIDAVRLATAAVGIAHT